jgi:hypothetical protein
MFLEHQKLNNCSNITKSQLLQLLFIELIKKCSQQL